MLGTHSTLNVDGKLCDVVEFDDEDSLPNETHDDRCIPLLPETEMVLRRVRKRLLRRCKQNDKICCFKSELAGRRACRFRGREPFVLKLFHRIAFGIRL